MQEGSYSYRLFARNDFSAFWALFTDNLINLIVLSGICQFVFQMPAEIVSAGSFRARRSPFWPGSWFTRCLRNTWPSVRGVT